MTGGFARQGAGKDKSGRKYRKKITKRFCNPRERSRRISKIYKKFTNGKSSNETAFFLVQSHSATIYCLE